MAKNTENPIVRFIKGAISLAQGMGITFAYLFRKPITVQYPDQKLEMFVRFRGRLVLPVDPEKGTNRCTACMRCVKVCPNHSIDVVKETSAEDGAAKPRPASYTYNLGSCIFCNLCVETCPFFALVMSDEYELAATDRTGLVIDLVAEKHALAGKKAAWWKAKFKSGGGAS